METMNEKKMIISVIIFVGHHSLVTPIDWKPLQGVWRGVGRFDCHHSLVTPIDWKQHVGV